MRDAGADVVAVQELVADQAAALARVLPCGRLDPALDYSGMGIARRTPGRVWRLPLPPRDAYLTDLELTGAAGAPFTVELINLHIVGPHLLPPWWAYASRRAQLRGIEAHLAAAPDRRRVLVGDLNSTPVWPAYRRLTRRLRDGALDAVRADGARPARTWGPWPGSPRLFRIDHVLVHGVAVDAVRVVPVRGSDHSALVIDLSLAPGAIHRDG